MRDCEVTQHLGQCLRGFSREIIGASRWHRNSRTRAVDEHDTALGIRVLDGVVSLPYTIEMPHAVSCPSRSCTLGESAALVRLLFGEPGLALGNQTRQFLLIS